MKIVNISGGELRIPVGKGGGAEEYILNISKCLSRMGHDVTILDRKYSLTDSDIEYVDGVKIVRLKARMFSSPILTVNLTVNYISFARQVRKYLATVDSDVVHVHVSIIGLYLTIISRVLRDRLFYTSHATRRGKTSRTPLDKMAIALENFLVKRVRRAIVLNESVRGELISKARVNPKDLCILPMGTNTELFNPAIDVGNIREKYDLNGKAIILFVGRIREDKGIEYLLKAANIVVNEFGCEDVQFVLVGPTEEFVLQKKQSSPYLNSVLQLIKDFRLQHVVRLTGVVPLDDLRKLYAACDLFVLPSLTEAAPQAVIEAMSSGKPVIGTRVGAIPTQIDHGQSGFLVDPADEHQLAERFKYLIDEPDERKRMGAYGRKLAEANSDWSKITEKLLQVYNTEVIDSTA